jgi:hypothetical protein
MKRRLVVIVVAAGAVLALAGGATAVALRGSDETASTSSTAVSPDPAQSAAAVSSGDTAAEPAAEAPADVAATEDASAPTELEAPATTAPSSAAVPIDPNEPLSGPATRDDQAPVDLSALVPVAVEQPVDFGNGILAAVSKVESVTVEAAQPGETAGPAVAVHVTIENRTESALNLDGVAVNVSDLDGTPLVPHYTSEVAALAGSLEPGGSRSGIYLFRTDVGINDLTIDVHHDSAANFVVVET